MTIYAAAEGMCPDGTQVVVFNSNEARDQWAEVARSVGLYVLPGDRYVVAGDSEQVVTERFGNTQ